MSDKKTSKKAAPAKKADNAKADEKADAATAKGKGKAKAPDTKKDAPAAAAKPAPKKALSALPALDAQRLSIAEMTPFASDLDVDALIRMLNDGRPTVRANATLGLAVLGHATERMVPLLRDGKLVVAQAAVDNLTALGAGVVPILPQIIKTLPSTVEEIKEGTFRVLDGLRDSAPDALIDALDIVPGKAEFTIVEVFVRGKEAGSNLLLKALGDDRMKVRLNASVGLTRLAKTNGDVALPVVKKAEKEDESPDVRQAAGRAVRAILAPPKNQILEHPPVTIDGFETDFLTAAQAKAGAAATTAERMVIATKDGRANVRANAALVLGALNASAEVAAGPLGMLLRDSSEKVRLATAQGLGQLKEASLAAAPALVGALGDKEEDVAAAIAAALEQHKSAVLPALLKGLETGDETHGRRILALLVPLPSAPQDLYAAFETPAVNVQVNAARGLGLLGDRVGEGRALLESNRTGGDARTRRAVMQAIHLIDGPPPEGPPPIPIPGFEDKRLTVAELEASKDKIDAARMQIALTDGREDVKANACDALGIVGADAAPAALGLAVCTKDSSEIVRAAAVSALGKVGAGTLEQAGALVAALGDKHEEVASNAASSLAPLKSQALPALIKGLETSDPVHAGRILELINVLPEAAQALHDQLVESPAENVRVNAAVGMGRLGKEKVGKLREALEDNRTGGGSRLSQATLHALFLFDGPKHEGLAPIEVPGFEDKRLTVKELEAAKDKLEVGRMTAALTDGREIARANACDALGVLGAASAPSALSLAVCTKDSSELVRAAACDALGKIGAGTLEQAGALVAALGDDEDEVADNASASLAPLKSKALAALIKGLDTPSETHAARIIKLINVLPEAPQALHDVVAESPAENARVNAAVGMGLLGKKIGVLRVALEENRTGGGSRLSAATIHALELIDGPKAAPPKPIELKGFDRKLLKPAVLAEHAPKLGLVRLMHALKDGRETVRANAATCLGVLKEEAASAALPLSVLLKDSVWEVRESAAKAFGEIPSAAIEQASGLVGALGDAEDEVVEAATKALLPLGNKVLAALIKGLDTGEEHGENILKVINVLKEAPDALHEAFLESPAVNTKVNAARGFALLGPEKVGDRRVALEDNRTGGDARTRKAVRLALEILDGPPPAGPPPITIPKFELKLLKHDVLAAAADKINADRMTIALQDGRETVRANAATALGVLGDKAAGAGMALSVLLRDSMQEARFAAANAFAKIPAAAEQYAPALVGALGDEDEDVADALAGALKPLKSKVVDALVGGLETDSPVHAERILKILNLLPEAQSALCGAFSSPSVAAQVNSAAGFAMLGNDKVGEGRALLEGARTGGDAATRAAVRKALLILDGPPDAGPPPITIAGFEERLLGEKDFGDKIDGDRMVLALKDGREVVRANAATAVGLAGKGAGAPMALAVLLRDEFPQVRLAAATALGKLGPAMMEVVDNMVGALGDDEPEVVAVLQKTLTGLGEDIEEELLNGLSTESTTHGKNILDVFTKLPDAPYMLAKAFQGPSVSVQVNAACGLGMVGVKRLGKHVNVLLGARTGGDAQTREAVFKALDVLGVS